MGTDESFLKLISQKVIDNGEKYHGRLLKQMRAADDKCDSNQNGGLMHDALDAKSKGISWNYVAMCTSQWAIITFDIATMVFRL